jgi:hypothetical protein
MFYSFGSFAFYKLGRKISSCGQYPPPGSNFPFRVKILKGKKQDFRNFQHIQLRHWFYLLELLI